MCTHAGFVCAALKDELLGLMVPVLDRGVRRRQAGRPQGQTGLSVPVLMPLLGEGGGGGIILPREGSGGRDAARRGSQRTCDLCCSPRCL